MNIKEHDENSASLALSIILKEVPKARQLLRDLLVEKGCKVRVDFSNPELRIEHRYAAENREIDLILHDDRDAVIFECKVRDRPKPYQIVTYRNYWQLRTGREPLMVWLVQQSQRIMGAGSEITSVVTWNELVSKFMTSGVLDEIDRLREFCEALIEAKIALPDESRTFKLKRCAGYQQEHAKRILEGVRDSIPEIDGTVEEINELPPCLHVSRSSWWTPSFRNSRPVRIWFFFKPLSMTNNKVGPFFFQSTFILYNRMYEKSAATFLERASAWIASCRKAELAVWRNVPGKWKRRERLSEANNSGIRLNYVHAEAENPKLSNVQHWDDEKLSISDGRNELLKAVSFVGSYIK